MSHYTIDQWYDRFEDESLVTRYKELSDTCRAYIRKLPKASRPSAIAREWVEGKVMDAFYDYDRQCDDAYDREGNR